MPTHEPLPLSAFCCQKKRCQAYGKKGLGNIYQHGWTNKAKTIRNLHCNVCHGEFSERKGTPFFGSQLPEEKILAVARHLAEGDGVRKTGRLVGVQKDTVGRYNRLLGLHGKALHDEKVRHVRVREAQAYEMWSFVGKKG